MFTHSITSGYAGEGGNVITLTKKYTGQTEVAFDGTVPATTDNEAVTIAWIAANVKALLLYSDTALTIKTNSSGTPVNTVTLAAGQIIVWGNDHPEPNPIAANVTELFLSNDQANIANVSIRVLLA
jgi:hypothetical protein